MNPLACTRLSSRSRVTASALTLLFLLASAASAQDALPLRVANEPALRINAEIVSVREVESVFLDGVLLLRDKLRKGRLKADTLEDALRDAWKTAIRTTIQDTLLDQLGARKRREIRRWVVYQSHPGTSERRMAERFKRLEAEAVRRLKKEKIATAGGEQELRAALKRKGIDMYTWERELKRELFRRWVLYQDLGPVHFSPGAAKEYFETHREDFSKPDRWRLQRIRIPKSKFKTEETARTAAELIHKKLTEGFDFARLAAELKYDPPYSAQGGLLTVNGRPDFGSGNFPEEERIGKGLKDGGLSGPVELKDAYLIVKRIRYQPAVNPTYENVAERVAALTFNEQLRKKKSAFFEKQKNSAFIKVLIPEPPARWLKHVKATPTPKPEPEVQKDK